MTKFVHRGPTYLRFAVFEINRRIYIEKAGCEKVCHIHPKNSKPYDSALNHFNLELDQSAQYRHSPQKWILKKSHSKQKNPHTFIVDAKGSKKE